MADIFYNDIIYVGVMSKSLLLEDEDYRDMLISYDCPQPHPFKDEEDVTGKWTLQYQCQCGNPVKHTINQCDNVVKIAVPKEPIPLPPTTATEGEAKELVDKFKRWHFQAQPIQQEYFAKQCAIIHLEGLKAENLSLLEMATLHMDSRAVIVINTRLLHLNHLSKLTKNL